jgi:hypothetical protein
VIDGKGRNVVIESVNVFNDSAPLSVITSVIQIKLYVNVFEESPSNVNDKQIYVN